MLQIALGILTKGISHTAGVLFGNSKIGTDSFPIKGFDMENATTAFPKKFPNEKNEYTHETLLISGSGASYKVYYEVITKVINEGDQ